MPDILLKPVDANDAPFICRLMNMPAVLSVLREIPTDLSVWEEAIPLWQADPDEEDLIITLDGQPVGWLGVNGLAEKTAYIKMLVLLPEYQRRGIGAAALMQLLGVLRRRGYADAALYTDEENLSARRCYEKCGFAVTEHLFEEMSDGSFPARVKMERSL